MSIQSTSEALNAIFSDNVVTQDEFLPIFQRYDESGDGRLEGDELNAFAAELAKTDAAKKAELNAADFVEIFVAFYDAKGDEKFAASELLEALGDFVRPEDSDSPEQSKQ